jgi:hypothetical protein
VALDETTHGGQASAARMSVVRRGQDRTDGFLLRGIDETARVDDQEIGGAG